MVHSQLQGELTQAAKATKKKAHCWEFSMRTSLMGFGTLCMGGLSDENLVAA
jgi:hypothetical protein